MRKINLSNFYDFAGGVKVEESQVLEWLEQVKKRLIESDSDNDFSFVASGNTIVLGFKFDSGEYEFIVADKYKALSNYEVMDGKLEDIKFV